MIVGKELHGRKQIFTNETEINDENVLRVLNSALSKHASNRSDIEYLENYLRGVQPVLDRTKSANVEILNKIVVNLANQIVTFKVANFAGEAIQYVSRSGKKTVPKKVERLNAMMISEGKQSKDMELAYKMFTCGVGYRLVVHDRSNTNDYLDEAPFEIYIPDPRNTFVVRSNDVSKKVVMGVTYVFLDDNNESRVRYTVYTPNVTYTIEGSTLSVGTIVGKVVHNFGMVSLVEYPCNPIYMGAFEVVHDLLNAYSALESDRLDGVEQKIESLLVLQGIDVDKEELMELRDLGAIKIPPSENGSQSVYFVSADLDQQQTQTLVDNMYQEILQIVGMPGQGNANTSDSSNNGAVILKNGWWNAESRALETEGMWTVAENEFLKIVLKICQDTDTLNGLNLSDVKLKFGRRSYEDKLVKTQSFTTLIDVGVPPIQAYTISGMVTDPEAAAIQFEEYQKEKKAEQEQEIEKELADARAEALRNSGQTSANFEQEDGQESASV